MSKSIKPEKIISAMAAIVAAITNMRLYPPASAIITNGIDKAYNAVKSAVVQGETLLIAESENNILISGQALSYKHQQLPQVVTLREIMSGLRLKSIILKKGMDKNAFKTFLTIMSMSPEEVELGGGIQKVTSNASLLDISLTPKIYVTAGQEREIFGSLEPEDIDLIKTFLEENNVADNEYRRIGEKADNPKWVADLFQSGIKQVEASGGALSDEVLPQAMGKMLKAFETSTPVESRAGISKGIAGALFNADNDLFNLVMANNHESDLFETIISALSDEQYVEFMAKNNRIREDKVYGDKKMSSDEEKNFNIVFKRLAKNKKTAALSKNIKEKIISEKQIKQKEKQQLNRLMEKIFSGDQTPFSDEFVMDKIPGIVSNMYKGDNQDKARSVISRLAGGLVSESKEIRARVSKALLKISERFSGESGRQEMARLAHSLNLWIKTETEITPSYEPVCTLLQNHIRFLLKNNSYAEANLILETFSFIFYDRTPKIEPIKAIAGRVLANVGTEDLFGSILHEFNTNNNNEGKNAYYTLIRLGLISLDALLDLLRSSSDMSHRIRIMNAIHEIGKISIPAVVERLQHSSSWFYIRNLLKLLSQMGNEENLDVLKSLLTSEDHKIASAALYSAFDIGGEKRLKFFTSALAIERDEFRAVVVDLLGKLGNEVVVYNLTELLKAEAKGSAEEKNRLDIAICKALAKIGSKKAIPVLKAIAKQKGILGIGAYSPEVRTAAENTLKRLNKKPAKKIKKVEKNQKRGGKEPELEKRIKEILSSDPSEAEAQVKKYVQQKNIPHAVKLLYELIVKLAREKRFHKADEMRNWLFEIDPMALSEIVKSGDIIESEKSSAVANEYIDIWSDFNKELTRAEANALFYSVRLVEYGINETIIKQGDINSRLYFINRGQLKIVYKQDNNEFFLKMLGTGDIAGDETFFPITVSTVSLVTLSEVKAGYLEREKLKSLKENHPLLEEKIMAYCSAGNDVNALINKKGLERRLQERVDVKGKTLVQLLDALNKSMGKPFKGDMIDVSLGGLAFKINTTKKDTARLLLGRKLKMIVGIVTSQSPVEVSKTGTILGVREIRGGQYSVHMKFDKPVTEKKLAIIRSTAIPE